MQRTFSSLVGVRHHDRLCEKEYSRTCPYIRGEPNLRIRRRLWLGMDYQGCDSETSLNITKIVLTPTSYWQDPLDL
jgi:hypothetical protein